MIKVTVDTGNYKVSAKKIEDIASKTLLANGVKEDADVNITIVDEETMNELNKKYYKNDNTLHPIFTFPETLEKSDFVFPPDNILHLGQIAILATNEKKVLGLVEHGCLHLVGIHH